MSTLNLNETQSKNLLSVVFSSAGGTEIKPDGVSFKNRGKTVFVDVEGVCGNVRYTPGEVVEVLKEWLNEKLHKEADVAFFTTDNETYNDYATDHYFSNIEISNISNKDIFGIQKSMSPITTLG